MTSLEAGGLQRRGPLPLFLMSPAVRRPGCRLESLLVDRLAVDEAAAIRAVFDALEGGPYLLQRLPVGRRLLEPLFLDLVEDALVGSVMDRIRHRFAGLLLRPLYERQEPLLLLDQPSLVVLYIQGPLLARISAAVILDLNGQRLGWSQAWRVRMSRARVSNARASPSRPCLRRSAA